MAIATIPQAIERGDISVYLSANDNSKGAIFSPRLAANGSPVTIALVTDALRWGYDGGAQTDESLREVANYLIWLTGMYGQEAQFIAEGVGGGTVTPIPSGGQMPFPLDFIVDAATTPFIGGQSTLTITQFIGFNVEFDRGGQPQYTTNPGDGSSYWSWNRVTGVMTIFPAANIGEPFRIVPIGAGQTAGGSTASQKQPLTFIVGTTPDAPTAGTSTWTYNDFAGVYITLFLNGTIVSKENKGDGTPYISKDFASNMVTIFNYQWQANDWLQYILITP